MARLLNSSAQSRARTVSIQDLKEHHGLTDFVGESPVLWATNWFLIMTYGRGDEMDSRSIGEGGSWLCEPSPISPTQMAGNMRISRTVPVFSVPPEAVRRPVCESPWEGR